MADVAITNTTSAISGKTVLLAESDQSVSGLHTYDRDPSAPFAVSASSAVVANLDADKLDGYEATAFPRKAEDATVTGNWTFSGTISGISGLDPIGNEVFS